MSSHPDVFVDTIAEGVQRARFSKYAFLLESTMNAYYTARYCKLTKARTSPLLLLLFSSHLLCCTYIRYSIAFSHSKSYDPPQVGDLLDQKNYGIAHARPSDIRAAVDLTLLDLKEKSVLQQLEARWWKERGIRVESNICHEVFVLTCASSFPFILRRR